MKVLVGAFNLEEALAGAFSMIVKTDCETDGALQTTIKEIIQAAAAASSAEFFSIYVLLSFV